MMRQHPSGACTQLRAWKLCISASHSGTDHLHPHIHQWSCCTLNIGCRRARAGSAHTLRDVALDVRTGGNPASQDASAETLVVPSVPILSRFLRKPASDASDQKIKRRYLEPWYVFNILICHSSDDTLFCPSVMPPPAVATLVISILLFAVTRASL
ncbi:hypothetical protein CPB84DRAFT_414643 [Gymnopilus junonius]|uniref:Uncharacterized protein n=1 Tax=Gymnopilus junonius TaxID=109634 RepID=A0A9P5NAT0_GYMJU|nr:hypothetical protein CPB84DRAFT_414643 [Gymnopilus junonius]